MHPVWKAVAIALQVTPRPELNVRNIPVIIWGPPGVGKTERVRAIARHLGLPMAEIHPSHYDPTEIHGLPAVVNGKSMKIPPDWAVELIIQMAQKAGIPVPNPDYVDPKELRRILEQLPKNRILGVVFADEFSGAPPATQNALLDFLYSRRVARLVLPVSVVGAANPAGQGAGVFELEPASGNRFVHEQWEGDLQEFVRGMSYGFDTNLQNIPILPEDWYTGVVPARATVAAFMLRKPALHVAFPKEYSEQGRAWPSERSWDNAAILMAAARAVGADPETEALLIGGCVGAEAAREFLTWVKELDLPDPEELLSRPETFRPPQRGDILLSVLNSVYQAVSRRPTQERYDAAWAIVDQAARQAKDTAMMTAKELIRLGERHAFRIPETVYIFEDLVKLIRRVN